MLRFTSKIFAIIYLISLGCDDIPRDNLLDPKNPEGARTQVVSLESFVNTNPEIPFDYNFEMLMALNDLKSKYGVQITILEYHRNVQDYTDPYHSIENEALYTKYVAGVDPGSKGVPDVFINGTVDRVQGAFDGTGSTKIRLEQAIAPLLMQNTFYAIEPGINKTEAGYEISAIIARLGTSDGSNLLVKAVVVSEEDQTYHRRVVKLISKSNVISHISAGEIKEIDFPTYQPENQNPASVVYFITSEDETVVYQCTKVDLQ